MRFIKAEWDSAIPGSPTDTTFMPYHPAIGIDARMYGAEQTGIGKYIARILEYVPPLMKKARFVAFLREPEFSRFNSPHRNVEKRRANARWYGYAEQTIFPAQLLKERVDLMHFPHFNVPLAYPKKFIVTIHDLTPHAFPGPRMGSWWRRGAYHLVFSSALKRAARIIAVSRYTKDDIRRTFGTSDDKLTVIYEGIDNAFTSPPSQEASRAFMKTHYRITNPFILYFGVWREHKNLTGLVRAYHALLKRYGIDVDLVLAGKEQESYPEPQRAWEELGIGNRVIRPGFIPEAHLAHFYRTASLTVVPSFAEGFGFTGLESLACGTPTAVSRVTSLPEILGDAAFYFDPKNIEEMADTLNTALTDEQQRTRRLKAAIPLLQTYRWQETAIETARLYRKLLH